MTSARLDPTAWKKSSASNSGGCVEVVREGTWTLVRDSKNPTGPQLRFNAREWNAFLAGVRGNEFDLPEK
jgi:predicted secreted Zn-dependent protease